MLNQKIVKFEYFKFESPISKDVYQYCRYIGSSNLSHVVINSFMTEVPII